MKREELAVIAVTLIYCGGTALIFKAVDNNTTCLLAWIIWTLVVVAYIAISEYKEDSKESKHKQIKAVYEAEMKAINERDSYWSERGERK
jgi:uncharacterized membrane protein SirB2